MATVTSSRVLLPVGLLAPDPAVETYRVQPGGATEVALHGDDPIRIIDRHGGQVAELSGELEAVGLEEARLFGPDSPAGSDVRADRRPRHGPDRRRSRRPDRRRRARPRASC